MSVKTKRLKKVQTQFVSINLHKCKACWKCVDNCHRKIIGKVSILWHKHIVFTDSDNCSGCHKCIKTCPHEALYKIN